MLATWTLCVLDYLGVECSIDQAICISPSRTSLENYVLELAVDQTLIVSMEIQVADAVYLASDGGQDGACITKISFWNKDKLKEYLLDVSSKGKTSLDIGTGTIASFQKLRPPEDFQLLGATTDSGGGGTLESGSAVLQDGGLAVDDEGFLVCSCTLHNLQLCLVVPTKMFIGEGGIDTRTSLQLFHSIYYLQSSLGSIMKDFLKHAWFKMHPHEQVPRELLLTIQEPLPTRWWTVFAAASYCLKFWDVLYLMAVAVAGYTTTDDKSNRVASNMTSLMDEPLIYADTCFLTDFHVSAGLSKYYALILTLYY